MIQLIRRSRLEIIMELLDLCVRPGLPRAALLTKAHLHTSKLHDILFGLLDDRMIKVETRPRSFSGQKRDTDYYLRTDHGDEIMSNFRELTSHLTTVGSPSRSGSNKSKD